jgi:hypothetical protein
MLAPSFTTLILALSLAARAAAQDAVLTFDHPDIAGISGFRADWNDPIPLSESGATQIVDMAIKDRGATAVWSRALRRGQPGAIAFDALNRSLLVRFPGAAAVILEKLKQGYAVKKLELVLPYRDTELWPPGDPNFALPYGYFFRMGWGVDQLYRKLAPRWHAVAWALRRPWQSDEVLGPTFNAYINGAGFWTKYGATDEKHDRFPSRFGPVEVSDQAAEGRLDVTALLNDSTFGSSLAARLQQLDCCGLIINKLETYDARYFTSYSGAYEWATATGGRAILVNTPKLVVTLSRPPASATIPNLGALPPSVDVAQLVEKLKANDASGIPTATLPFENELAETVRQFAQKPGWMPSWQWDRINELKILAGTKRADRPFFYDFVPSFVIDRLRNTHKPPREPSSAEVYFAWIDSIVGRQPRGWSGFEPASEMSQWFVYGSAMPEPARDAVKRYWTAWLMPERDSAPADKQLDRNLLDGTLVHPQIDQLTGGFLSESGLADSYYAATGDWRGNKSFYRSGYTRTMSTENFNHTSALGALLGGSIIDSPNAIADGRQGWENYPLRVWSWNRGASQENIDHYYFALTISDQKALADFGPTVFDRLMGESTLGKSIDEVVAAYHPGLKRFIAPSTRTSLEYLLAKQDGLQYMLHTLSHVGTLHDANSLKAKALLPGLQTVIGEEVPPNRIALQTITKPWAPEWVANLIDDKPLPYRSIALGDGVLTSYLGHNYGLATATQARRIQLLAQWRRDISPVENMSHVVTVVSRYGLNDTRFANDAWGWTNPVALETFLQHDNKVVLLSNPRDSKYARERIEKEGLKSLQASIALFNYQQPTPSWEIHVDGVRVTELPYTARAGAKIAIRDGISFLGIVTAPISDLGGGNVVVLREGTAQEWNKIVFKPALVVDCYNLKSADPVSNPDWSRIESALAGFALEVADISDYPSFEEFKTHLASTQLDIRFQGGAANASVAFRSGNDILETGVKIGKELKLVDPKVSGRPAFLPVGILRDTSTSTQGDAATIEKGGAVLKGEQGRMKFIQVEPKSGTFVGWNPLPDLAEFSFTVPGGIRVEANGRLGMARVAINPAARSVEVSQAWREGQAQDAGAATALIVSGFANPPTIELNGRLLETLETNVLKDRLGYIVPLRDGGEGAGTQSHPMPASRH